MVAATRDRRVRRPADDAMDRRLVAFLGRTSTTNGRAKPDQMYRGARRSRLTPNNACSLRIDFFITAEVGTLSGGEPFIDVDDRARNRGPTESLCGDAALHGHPRSQIVIEKDAGETLGKCGSGAHGDEES